MSVLLHFVFRTYSDILEWQRGHCDSGIYMYDIEYVHVQHTHAHTHIHTHTHTHTHSHAHAHSHSQTHTHTHTHTHTGTVLQTGSCLSLSLRLLKAAAGFPSGDGARQELHPVREGEGEGGIEGDGREGRRERGGGREGGKE